MIEPAILIPFLAKAADNVAAGQLGSRIALSKISLSFLSNSLDSVRTRQDHFLAGGWLKSSNKPILLAYRQIIFIVV